jgi:transcription initiation factor TFIIH subunit 1
VFDKYLNFSESDSLEREKKALAAHIPHYMDVEGNEQNNSQRQGNAPDVLGRQSYVPVVRTLNDLSEKLISKVRAPDVDPSEPLGQVDDATFQQVAIVDLEQPEADHQRPLEIDEQVRLSTKAGDDHGNSRDEAAAFADDPGMLYRGMNPENVLIGVRQSLAGVSEQTLEQAIGVDEDSSDPEDYYEESDDDETPDKVAGARKHASTHLGSKLARMSAARHLFASIKAQQASEALYHHTSAETGDSELSATEQATQLGLTTSTYELAVRTSAAANVYLNLFWAAFGSGDARRAGELAGLVESLGMSVERVHAAAEQAERDRDEEIERWQQRLQQHTRRTGEPRRIDSSSVKGGRAVVLGMLRRTVDAIENARQKYVKAVEEAKADQQQQQTMLLTQLGPGAIGGGRVNGVSGDNMDVDE